MPPPTLLVQGTTIRDHHMDGNSVTAMEVFAVVQTKRERKETKKTKVIGSLMPPAKGPKARSYHRIMANGGSSMDRGTATSLELTKGRKKTKKQRHVTKKRKRLNNAPK